MIKLQDILLRERKVMAEDIPDEKREVGDQELRINSNELNIIKDMI